MRTPVILTRFLKSDSGAVTVDWVVLTAATVGLGVGAVTVVRSGQEGLAGDISSSLSGAAVAQMGTVNVATMTFDDGNFTGWSVSRLGYSAVLGGFLGPFAGNEGALLHQVQVPDGATSATVTFDLMLLNSWDATNNVYSDITRGGRGDGIAFTINGTEVGFSAMASTISTNPTGSMVIDGTTYSYTMSHQANTSIPGTPTPTYWHDARWSVSLTATNPPPGGFMLGIDGTTDQSVGDESFGIDNFRVDAVTP